MSTLLNVSSKKYAVIIGINYYNTSSELSGCINDAQNLKTFLMTKCNYTTNDIYLLLDDNVNIRPTKQNIINAFNLLLSKAAEGYSELWLSYSGHGSYLTDNNMDENDNKDEVICPVDYNTSGMISDDYIYENLLVKLPSTVTLFSLFDSCHSGSILDLPFIYKDTKLTNNNNTRHVANIVSISGCRDDQTSADAYINAKYQGAMTWSFLTALTNKNYTVNIVDLVNSMRLLLKNNYTQIPLLAVSFTSLYDKNLLSTTTINNTKPIKFKMTTDYWYRESSWNILSLKTNSYIFTANQTFTTKYQTVEVTKDLPLGLYELCVFDMYGDGGITSLVTDNNLILINAKFLAGKSAKYSFEIK